MGKIVGYEELGAFGPVVLSSHGIFKEVKVGGNKQLSAIPIHSMSYCAVEMKSNPLLLYLGVACLLFGAAMAMAGNHQQALGGMSLVGGATLVVAHFATKSVMLVIGSSGGSITTKVGRSSYQKAVDFAALVQRTTLEASGVAQARE